jgi:hypothetical protein
MRMLIVTVLITIAFLALVSATAIALLALPQDELMYAAQSFGPQQTIRL